MIRPPTVTELVGCSEPVFNLDARCVIKNFLGKSQDDARKMYPSPGMYATEDFAYMASDGLRYYLAPAFDYLCDAESTHDWEFCHGLLCSLSCQVRPAHRLSGDVMLLMKKIASYCDAHREKFGLDAQEDLFDGYLRAINAG